MRLGAVFPTTEIGSDPHVVRDWAQAAEELGYAHIVVYDHVLGAVHADREPILAGPYTEVDPFHEPFVLYGYLAGVTDSIEMEIAVLVLPQRQTALVAKQAAEVQVLSEGRLRLGVGTGWNHVEYGALGADYAARGRMLDEQVEVLRALWTEPVVDYSGDYHRIDRAGILPLPDDPIPLWFGGYSPPALRRAARSGDGFVFGHAGRPMLLAFGDLREQLVAAGRDPASFPVETILDYSLGRDQWVSRAESWRAAGATHVTVRTMDTGHEQLGVAPNRFETPSDHINALAAFMDAMS